MINALYIEVDLSKNRAIDLPSIYFIRRKTVLKLTWKININLERKTKQNQSNQSLCSQVHNVILLELYEDLENYIKHRFRTY